MAHLWIEHWIEQGQWTEQGRDQEWGILPLRAERLELTDDPTHPVRVEDGKRIGDASAALQPAAARGTEWVLLCRPGSCRVNGEPVALGIQMLRDRDEIQTTNGPRLFFSAEIQAQVTPFAGAAQAAPCPRCLLEIAPGQPAVICPGCGVAYHEDGSTELLCWTYGVCTFCGQPGALDAGFRWTPDEL